jgi:hypothetical protein
MRPRAALALLAAAGAMIVSSPALQAYLKLGTQVGNSVVSIEWTQMPINYRITNRAVTGVSASQLQGSVAESFDEWASAGQVELSAQFAGFTNIEPSVSDGLTVIGFQSRPEDDRTLGATNFQINAQTGAIVASDIFLNSFFPWSVAESGQASRFDVESIMVHEIGHLLGLGHSALGETTSSGGGRSVQGKRAVMFSIAYGSGTVEDRTLEADDIAGIRDIYGTSEARSSLGAISGRVTLNGSGIFGAHLTAINIATGEMVGGFSLNTSGDFVIGALPPGIYVVRAEPLDDADIDSFFDDVPPVELDFRATYHSKQVAVPAGGTSGNIEIRVRAK